MQRTIYIYTAILYLAPISTCSAAFIFIPRHG